MSSYILPHRLHCFIPPFIPFAPICQRLRSFPYIFRNPPTYLFPAPTLPIELVLPMHLWLYCSPVRVYGDRLMVEPMLCWEPGIARHISPLNSPIFSCCLFLNFPSFSLARLTVFLSVSLFPISSKFFTLCRCSHFVFSRGGSGKL